jgi:hypothetical protein
VRTGAWRRAGPVAGEDGPPCPARCFGQRAVAVWISEPCPQQPPGCGVPPFPTPSARVASPAAPLPLPEATPHQPAMAPAPAASAAQDPSEAQVPLWRRPRAHAQRKTSEFGAPCTPKSLSKLCSPRRGAAGAVVERAGSSRWCLPPAPRSVSCPEGAPNCPTEGGAWASSGMTLPAPTQPSRAAPRCPAAGHRPSPPDSARTPALSDAEPAASAPRDPWSALGRSRRPAPGCRRG